MRIAIQNPFSGQSVAETELSKRFYQAALNLGWQAAEVYTAADIDHFQPDFVIALHNNSPKLAGFPTYGCMWNPLSFFEGTEKYVKHVLSYDGYLTSSFPVERWLHHILHHTPKQFFTVPFYTSCARNAYQVPNLENPRLIYLGSNWDMPRFQELFEQLDQQPYMEVYGNPEGWTHLQTAYKGALPYDGASVFQTLNQVGVGLCLHREEHTRYELPSMRIFEIVASGAIAICGEHPFIRKAFGDSVLYLDLGLSVEAQVQQISEYMEWIRLHPQEAIALSQKAHAIFLEHYTLEKLLLDIIPHHQRLIQTKGFIQSIEITAKPQVEFIIKIASDSIETSQKTFESLARQSYGNIGVIAIAESVEKAAQLCQLYESKFPIQIVESSANEFKSTQIWKGLNAVQAEYFAVLDQIAIHPNHAARLVSLLEKSTAGVAYSGALIAAAEDTSELIQFHPFDLDRLLLFEPLITLSAAIGRRSLLDTLLSYDPLLNEWVDLSILLYLAQQTQFLFSYEATCELLYPPQQLEQSVFQQSRDWSTEASRLRVMFWHQEFAPGKSIQTVHQAHLAQQYLQHQLERSHAELRRIEEQLQVQLQDAQAVIAAMESSKFWKLRTAWFKLKRAIGLPTNDEPS
ncbi:hypothetical protein H6G89_24770 [Oscillatoria sp. FACHB-1407]|uniref:glycosyltransferase family protein n=1 Tax=Oscillatoria sp. FACHB-1407 TaxID=2692847 RepID=UPI0016898B86|nr:hypothetical protein [Oscillatoria sp. FACHB-1407]MBD2464221.1 hypothetical protein [Oscillatoria sp. FACHB-1407]